MNSSEERGRRLGEMIVEISHLMFPASAGQLFLKGVLGVLIDKMVVIRENVDEIS